MTCLPDVNVWLSLIVPEHINHAAALEWYDSPEWDTLAFSRITQMGLLRLLTNRSVMGAGVMSIATAWETMDQLRRSDNIVFATEPQGIEPVWRGFKPAAGSGANFWTDAWLAAFAEVTGFTLVTFDQGFRKYRKAPVRILP